MTINVETPTAVTEKTLITPAPVAKAMVKGKAITPEKPAISVIKSKEELKSVSESVKSKELVEKAKQEKVEGKVKSKDLKE